MEESQNVVIGGTKGQIQLDVPRYLLGLDTDNAHAAWQNVLQVHEHFRPVETAHGNDAVNESGAVTEALDAFLIEEALQIVALLLISGVLLA